MRRRLKTECQIPAPRKPLSALVPTGVPAYWPVGTSDAPQAKARSPGLLGCGLSFKLVVDSAHSPMFDGGSIHVYRVITEQSKVPTLVG